MLHPIKSFLAAACTTLVLAQAAMAEDTPDTSQVVASVNGTDITLAHVIALRNTLPAQYDQFPPALLLQGIVDQLIQHTLLQQSLTTEPSLRSRVSIENEQRAIIAGEVMARVLATPPSEEAVRAAYDAQYPADVSETEYRASHILVETEEEAIALLAELAKGTDFAMLAREKSIGPSASVGGDLGWFGDGDMVDSFFNAVTALEPGDISQPVQTDFGWHVINLVETRNKERPEFSTVRDDLASEIQQNALDSFIADLRGKAEISQTDLTDIDANIITNIDLLEN